MKKRDTKNEKYAVRFILNTPVVDKDRKAKFIIINSEIGDLDFTFLEVVSQKMKSNGLKLAWVGENDKPVYSNEAKDLKTRITPELRVQKRQDPKNPNNLELVTALGKKISKPKSEVHNLYVSKEDYLKAKKASK